MDRPVFRLLAALLTVIYLADSLFVAAGHQHCVVDCRTSVQSCGHDCHDEHSAPDRGRSQQPSSPIHSPGHDHDDCAICHYLAQATVPAATVLLPRQTDLVRSLEPPTFCCDVSAPVSTYFSRGPPA